MSGEQSAFTEIFSRYRRLLQEDAWLRVASCWTVVLPRDHRLITDPEVGALVSGGTPHEVFAPVHPRDTADVTCSPVLVERDGPAVILFENNGFLGSLRPVLKRLSRNARVCSVYWNVRANNRFSYAADGEVLVGIDAMFPEEWAGRSHPVLQDELRELAAVLGDDGADWRAAAMAAVELCTGVALTRDWSERPLPFLAFTGPVADEPMPEKERAAFHSADPEVKLRLALDAAPEPVRLSALIHLVRRLVSRFELDGFPVVRTVVADLEAARYAGEQRITEIDEQLVMPLTEEFHRYEEEREDEDDEWDFEEDPGWRRMQASLTFDIAARGPGSRPMGFDAYHHAGLAFGDDWPTLREELREMLTGTST